MPLSQLHLTVGPAVKDCPYQIMVTDQLSVLKLVAARLDGARIPYMVTGSIAASYYAQPRMTRDIDLVVELQPEDAERVSVLFGGDFDCAVDAIRGAIERKSLFNLIHIEAAIKVDFIVRKDTRYRREEFRRRRTVVIDGDGLWLVSPEDLLLSKLMWARETRSEVQLRDVRSLIGSVRELDWPYIERWAADLVVSDLLREVRP